MSEGARRARQASPAPRISALSPGIRYIDDHLYIIMDVTICQGLLRL
jgi:hypothetical protein